MPFLADHHAAAHAGLVIMHVHMLRACARCGAASARSWIAATRAWLASVFLPGRPEISVVTPTWHRRRLLRDRAIPSVAAQSLPPAEHVIVSDGPDPALSGVSGITFLPAHTPAPNRGVHARAHGAAMAAGGLVAYLDDDNAWRPRHLELLAGALGESGADFAWSRAKVHAPGGLSWEIGCPPPAFGQVDTSLIMHRRELLAVATWEPSCEPADWHLIRRWVAAGARWVFVPVVTMDYYAR